MPKASPLQVGTEFSILRPAGTVIVPGKRPCPQRFTEDTFRESLGGYFVMRRKGSVVGVAKLLRADVADDGSAVSLVYQVQHLTEEMAA